jgi:hypothetical protein
MSELIQLHVFIEVILKLNSQSIEFCLLLFVHWFEIFIAWHLTRVVPRPTSFDQVFAGFPSVYVSDKRLRSSVEMRNEIDLLRILDLLDTFNYGLTVQISYILK